MAQILEISPELLLQQSQQMQQLKLSYEALMEKMLADINGINGSWSQLLANNFTAKIADAQKSFLGVTVMLQNGSNAAAMAATTLSQGDTTLATRLVGSFMAPKSVLTPIVAEGAEYVYEHIQDGYQILKGKVEAARAEMSASQRAWFDLIFDKTLKAVGGDMAKALKITSKVTGKVLEGDYLGALQTLGEYDFKEMAKEYITAAGVALGKNEQAAYINYGLNLIKDAAEGTVDIFFEGPSLENLGKLAWNLTGQPVLDTAGDYIYNAVMLVPGISEYYDAKGVENIGDMASVALGDWYSMISPDPGMKEYASTYYEEQGGLWEGLWNGGREIVSFVADNGPIGAVKKYVETVAKDAGAAWDHNVENGKILWKEAGEYIKNVQSFVDECGSEPAAFLEFWETAAKDTYHTVTDTAGRVWKALFS